MLTGRRITHLHNFSGDFLLAKPVDDNMGRYPSHTEHPALRAPGEGLDGIRVLLYYICIWLLLLTPSPLKDLGSLQLVQHLKHNFDQSRRRSQTDTEVIVPSVTGHMVLTKAEQRLSRSYRVTVTVSQSGRFVFMQMTLVFT